MLFLPIADITHIRQQIVTEFEFNNTCFFSLLKLFNPCDNSDDEFIINSCIARVRATYNNFASCLFSLYVKLSALYKITASNSNPLDKY